jgi:hypothetical protein
MRFSVSRDGSRKNVNPEDQNRGGEGGRWLLPFPKVRKEEIMKKLIALLMVLLIAGAAFAQIPDGFKVGGWSRADFVPFQGVFNEDDDVDPVYWTGVGSGWGPAYMGLAFTFTSDRIGGEIDFSGGNGIGDNLHIWAKPFGSDILYLKVGQMRDNRFRGPGTDGNFQGFVGGPGKNGDAVFQRFASNNGALFLSQPVTGLSLFAHFNMGDANVMNGIGPLLAGGQEAKDTYKKIQAGFAYDIANIGLARAQWYGDTMEIAADASKATPARIEAAFKLTAVENLSLDFGIKLPIPVKEEIAGVDYTWQDNFQVNAVATFKAGDFGITGSLYTGFAGSLAVEGQSNRSDFNSNVDILLIPSFYLAGLDATVGADVGFRVLGESSNNGSKRGDDTTTFGLGGWISRDLGNGLVKTGLAIQFPKYASNGTQKENAYFSWPIILELSF